MKKLLLVIGLGIMSGGLYAAQSVEVVDANNFTMLCTTVAAPLKDLNDLEKQRVPAGDMWWDGQEARLLGGRLLYRLSRDFDFMGRLAPDGKTMLYKKCRLYIVAPPAAVAP